MITVSVKGLLIGVLLIATIVLVIYLTVLVSNLTDTIKKTNYIIDGGTTAANTALAKVDEMSAKSRQNASIAGDNVQLGLQVINNFLQRLANR